MQIALVITERDTLRTNYIPEGCKTPTFKTWIYCTYYSCFGNCKPKSFCDCFL